MVWALTATVRLTWQLAVCAVRRQAALRQLQCLDARMLEDIGLVPGDLWSIADAHARGVPIEARHPRRRGRRACCRHASIVPRITATHRPATDTSEMVP